MSVRLINGYGLPSAAEGQYNGLRGYARLGTPQRGAPGYAPGWGFGAVPNPSTMPPMAATQPGPTDPWATMVTGSGVHVQNLIGPTDYPCYGRGMFRPLPDPEFGGFAGGGFGDLQTDMVDIFGNVVHDIATRTDPQPTPQQQSFSVSPALMVGLGGLALVAVALLLKKPEP